MLLDKLKTDNIVLQYIINFVVLSAVTLLMTHVNYRSLRPHLDSAIGWLTTRRRPELLFVARDPGGTHCSGLIASDEYKAWLDLIRKTVNNVSRARRSDLYKLQEFRARHSIWEDEEKDDRKEAGQRPPTLWIPNQRDSFKITNSISCECWTETDEETGERGRRSTKHHLRVFVRTREEQHTLLKYHTDLMAQHHAQAQLTLNAYPHIFECKKLDSETGRLEWHQYRFSSTRRIDHVWFKDKPRFLAAYERFLSERNDYESRGDPWTFSALLHGRPGCGKTSLLKAVANLSLDRDSMVHLFVVPFAKVETIEMFTQIMFDTNVNGHFVPLEQRILVFEDFDASTNSGVFKKRSRGWQQQAVTESKTDSSFLSHDELETKSATMEAGSIFATTEQDNKDKTKSGPHQQQPATKPAPELSLSDMLNVLDGLNERTGQRCFWTTNRSPPEKFFDEAFLRPGRMDVIIEFTRCTREGVKELTEQYYGGECPEQALGDIPEDSWTPAMVKQKCKEHSTLEGCLQALQEVPPTAAATAAEKDLPRQPQQPQQDSPECSAAVQP